MAIDTRVAENDNDERTVGTSMCHMLEHCGCRLITKALSG
jgi:hypothetical protein